MAVTATPLQHALRVTIPAYHVQYRSGNSGSKVVRHLIRHDYVYAKQNPIYNFMHLTPLGRRCTAAYAKIAKYQLGKRTDSMLSQSLENSRRTTVCNTSNSQNV